MCVQKCASQNLDAGLLLKFRPAWLPLSLSILAKKDRELTTVLNTLMSFALRAPCPGANDKDYIVGVNMCQPSKIHPGVLL